MIDDWNTPEHKAGYRALSLANQYRDLALELSRFSDRVKMQQNHSINAELVEAEIHVFTQYAKFQLDWLTYCKRRASFNGGDQS